MPGDRLEPDSAFDSHIQATARKHRNRITIGPGTLIGLPETQAQVSDSDSSG